MREKIDIHAHYFPPAYDQMLEKRGMKLLDGGFPKPEWNEEIQLSFMEKLGITYSVLSISSPHLHMGDVHLRIYIWEMQQRQLRLQEHPTNMVQN